MKKTETSFGKRLFAGLLAALMIFCLLPLPTASVAHAEGEEDPAPITPVALTVTLEQNTFTYDGTEHALKATVTNEGLTEADYSLSYTLNGEATAEPKVKEAGTYSLTVNAVSNKEGYSDAAASFEVQVNKAPTALDFTVKPEDEIKVLKGEKVEKAYAVDVPEGRTLSFASSNEDVATIDAEGTLTVVGYGTTTISATVGETENYEAGLASHTLSINPPSIDGITVEYYAGGVYDGQEHDAATVKVGGADPVEAGYQVFYRINSTSDDDWTDVCPKLKNAGDYNVEVYVAKENYANTGYSPVGSVKITKAQQALAFIAPPESSEMVIQPDENGTFTIPEIGLTAKNTTTGLPEEEMQAPQYSHQVLAGDPNAVVTTDGTLKAGLPGKYKVVATLPGNDNLEQAQIEFELSIRLAAGEDGGNLVKFEQQEQEVVLSDGPIALLNAAKTFEKDEGALSYSVAGEAASYLKLEEKEDGAELTVTDLKGLYKKLDAGEEGQALTVTVDKAADEYYGADKASYSLKIVLADAPSLSTEPAPAENADGWYLDTATVSAAGYTLAVETDDMSLTAENFTDKLVYDKENEFPEGGIVIIARDAQGRFTKSQTLELKIDTEAPKNLTLSYETVNADSEILSVITFNLFGDPEKTPIKISKDAVKVNMSAVDTQSGVASFTLSYTPQTKAGDGETVEVLLDGDKIYQTGDIYTSSLVIGSVEDAENPDPLGDQIRGIFMLIAKDKAGHESTTVNQRDVSDDPENPEIKDEVFVLDSESPIMSVSYSAGGPLYNQDVTVTVKVKEANFDLQLDENNLNSAITLSLTNDMGEVTVEQNDLSAPVWGYGEEESTCTFVVKADKENHSNDGNYVLKIQYTADVAGNDAEFEGSEVEGSYEGRFAIDTMGPKVTGITYNGKDSPGTPTKENVEITFTVTDRNLDPDAFESAITVQKTAPGAAEAETLTELSFGEWTGNGEEHKVTLTIPANEDHSGDGDYEISIGIFADLLGNLSEEEIKCEKFTIDTTAPEVIGVTYNGEDAPEKYNNSDVILTFTVKEWHLDKDALESAVTVTRDGVTVTDLSFGEWTDNGEEHKVTLTIPASEDHSDDGEYEISIKAFADLLGNLSEEFACESFVIDTTPPVVRIKYIDDPEEFKTYSDPENVKYYNQPRHAKITVEELNFSQELVLGGYTRVLPEGSFSFEGLNWATDDENSGIHTLEIPYAEDGRYTFDITSCIDLAGNQADFDGKEKYEESFVIDTAAPVIELKTNDQPRNLVEKIFAIFNPSVTFNISVKDATAGLDQVVWGYTPEGSVGDTAGEQTGEEKLNGELDKEFSFTLNEGKQYRGYIYVTASDRSGIETQTQTYKVTVDDSEVEITRVVVDTVAPGVKIEYSGEPNAPIYNTPVNVTITVTEANFDLELNGSSIAERFKVNLSGKLGDTELDLSGIKLNELSWTGGDGVYTASFEVPAVDGDYILTVDYSDLGENAANPIENPYEGKFTIDTTPPELTNAEFAAHQSGEWLQKPSQYYNEPVKIRFTVTDWNLDTDSFENAVQVKKNGADYTGMSFGDWTKDGDQNSVVMTIPASGNDGIFQVSVESFQDLAENTWSGDTSYDSFVIDTIPPTGTVTFNQPVATVGDVDYYDGPIVGTITIYELNFTPDRFTVTANGNMVPVAWDGSAGETHVGTFTINEDGQEYVVNVSGTDLADNGPFTFQSRPMTIDTQDPVIEMSGIENESANNAEVIGFTLSASDMNVGADDFDVKLTKVVKRDSDKEGTRYEYVTVDVPVGAATVSTGEDGQTVLTCQVENLEEDGFYFMIASITDKAGHEVTQIVTPSGEAVDEVRFSVNRDGSVFWVETEHNDKYSEEVFENKLGDDEHRYANDHVKVVVHEVNVDQVDELADKDFDTVFTLNDGSGSAAVELTERDNYQKNHLMGSGGWYETTYTLDDSNFDHDGVYSFNLVTYDMAGNSNVNSKEESGMLSFILDRTAPTITANVRRGQRINATEYTVEFKIAELNLEPDTVDVELLDNRGAPLAMDLASLGNNEYSFQVETGLEMSLEINAKDLAGNPAEPLKVERLTVSDNFLVLWYANKPLFWGSIGGVLVLGGTVTASVVGRKKKQKAEA